MGNFDLDFTRLVGLCEWDTWEDHIWKKCAWILGNEWIVVSDFQARLPPSDERTTFSTRKSFSCEVGRTVCISYSGIHVTQPRVIRVLHLTPPGHSACLRNSMCLKRGESGPSLVVFCQSPSGRQRFTTGINRLVGYELWLLEDVRKGQFKRREKTSWPRFCQAGSQM